MEFYGSRGDAAQSYCGPHTTLSITPTHMVVHIRLFQIMFLHVLSAPHRYA